VAQFLLFLVVFAIGSFFYHPFHLQTALSAPGRTFVWDGILLMLLLYALLLLIALFRKRLRISLPWATLALLLAFLAGWFWKFGFITRG
jgi:glucan phosphoethanolaminetransferase (alkaline phosphatase superfamily)